jgi:hypothetical protein
MAVHALKKITVRDVMKGKPAKAAVDVEVDGKKVTVQQVIPQNVCIIRGSAYDLETGKSDFGTFNRFIGTFEAMRISDGEVFQSTRIIFPPIAADIAFDVYSRAKAEDEGSMVEMAFVVGVEHDARGGEGYRWTCIPLATGEDREDPLKKIREATNAQLADLLGADKAKALGLTGPAATAAIGHDPKTGEVIEDKAKAKA